MTVNPLARRRDGDGDAPSSGRCYADIAIGESISYTTKEKDGSISRIYQITKTEAGFSADLAARYNAERRRDDIEWVATPGGLQCRSPGAYIAKRLTDDKRRFDDETRKAQHREKFPVAGGAA